MNEVRKIKKQVISLALALTMMLSLFPVWSLDAMAATVGKLYDVILEPTAVYDIVYNISSGKYLRVYNRRGEDQLWGLCDLSGKELFPAKYISIQEAKDYVLAQEDEQVYRLFDSNQREKHVFREYRNVWLEEENGTLYVYAANDFDITYKMDLDGTVLETIEEGYIYDDVEYEGETQYDELFEIIHKKEAAVFLASNVREVEEEDGWWEERDYYLVRESGTVLENLGTNINYSQDYYNQVLWVYGNDGYKCYHFPEAKRAEIAVSDNSMQIVNAINDYDDSFTQWLKDENGIWRKIGEDGKAIITLPEKAAVYSEFRTLSGQRILAYYEETKCDLIDPNGTVIANYEVQQWDRTADSFAGNNVFVLGNQGVFCLANGKKLLSGEPGACCESENKQCVIAQVPEGHYYAIFNETKIIDFGEFEYVSDFDDLFVGTNENQWVVFDSNGRQIEKNDGRFYVMNGKTYLAVKPNNEYYMGTVGGAKISFGICARVGMQDWNRFPNTALLIYPKDPGKKVAFVSGITGKTIFEADEITNYDRVTGYVPVKLNGKWGIYRVTAAQMAATDPKPVPQPQPQPQPQPAPVVTAPKAPAKATVKAVKAGKKRAILTMKKASGVKGYLVEYSLKKNFKGSKKKYVTGTKLTIKGLKSKKTYYFRTKAYKLNGKKKILSKTWSSVKKVKIK